MTERLEECLLCGSRNLQKDPYAAWTLNLAQKHLVTKCTNCSFRFLNPRPSRDDYAVMYRSGAGALSIEYPLRVGDFYEREEQNKIRQYRCTLRLLRRIGITGKMLDIGASSGIFLNEARSYGFEVFGIEPSQENRTLAKNRYGLDLKGDVVNNCEFAHSTFDVVSASHVFEHLADPLDVARRIRTWLKPGGYLVIEVPNQFDSFSARRRKWIRRRSRKQRDFLSIHHTVFFSCRTLRLLVEQTGFYPFLMRNIYYSAPQSWLNPLLLTARVMNKLFGGSGVIQIFARKD